MANIGKPLRILVLGETGFIGPHFIEAARACGHDLTLFNRGKTNSGLFKNADGSEQLHGDRKSELKTLEGRHWDAVLDTSDYIPADVTCWAGLVAKNFGHYMIVSTLLAARGFSRPTKSGSMDGPVLLDSRQG